VNGITSDRQLNLLAATRSTGLMTAPTPPASRRVPLAEFYDDSLLEPYNYSGLASATSASLECLEARHAGDSGRGDPRKGVRRPGKA